MPAIAEKPTFIAFGAVEKHMIAGEVLHSEREGQQEIERAKLELGSYAFAAQYQQMPVSKEEGMVQAAWLQYYMEEPAGAITQSWDTAIKAGDGTDYSVCTTWAQGEQGYYLLDLFRKRLEYPELKRYALALAEQWQPQAILIEDKASGQSLLQDLQRETALPLLPVKPKQDKVTRFAMVSPLFESGKVFLPKGASWLADLEMELLAFPHGSHDDQVDSISQYLMYASRKRKESWRVRKV